jgi:hypothetical protein
MRGWEAGIACRVNGSWYFFEPTSERRLVKSALSMLLEKAEKHSLTVWQQFAETE